jgi:hypothetical protein
MTAAVGWWGWTELEVVVVVVLVAGWVVCRPWVPVVWPVTASCWGEGDGSISSSRVGEEELSAVCTVARNICVLVYEGGRTYNINCNPT